MSKKKVIVQCSFCHYEVRSEKRGGQDANLTLHKVVAFQI